MDLAKVQVVEEMPDLASGEALRPGLMWAEVGAGYPAASIPVCLQNLQILAFHHVRTG
jgi:hypothetical protein